MMKPIPCLIAAVLLGTALAAPAAGPAVPVDPRVVVDMPDLQRALVLEDMQEHLIVLHEVLIHLAEGKLEAAADAAENGMGVSSMGKHAAHTAGKGPGQFMPEAMRNVGIEMHRGASEFAQVARKGDLAAALKALQPVMGACIACHSGYRLTR